MAKGAIITEKVFSSIMILHEANPELNSTQIGKVFKVDASTVGKMIRCGTWEKYEEFKKEKAEKGRQREKARREAEKQGAEEPQIEGQIRMDLVPAEETELKADLFIDPEKMADIYDQTKMMRFQAAQVDKLIIQNAQWMDEIIMKINQLNDTMSMVLRAIRRE